MTEVSVATEAIEAPDSARRRHLLYAGVGAVAAVAGAGAALWKWRTGPVSADEVAALWAMNFDTPDGSTLSMASLRGKPLILNFWATWCGPCWEEHPTLVANARELGESVQFVGVVFQDSEEKIQTFLTQRGSAYPTLIDEKGKTAIAYGVGGIPETYFLDKNGVRKGICTRNFE